MADDVKDLLARIDALQELLVCYRLTRRPTERLFNKLERTRVRELQIRKTHDL